ncbi:AMP-dependent synthetase and ligase [Methanothermus fervidus DSM 2088]|uniref:AMP-dependent synthetase and ligase n=1 Tax=Methanothermus fervidus (strain ATCC 43054 / DSM 2088 / JCM 10308 / V24 S) TaxID=523846 RepID=E3GWM0_METFV|nr:AMP-binding protein [Methanothermus fervidus]ADP76834.1 AMP-dependent synthetase and ligase [Methanothermus fervidus DSM 2088]
MVFTEKTIHEFLEEQAKKYPNKDFIVYPDRNLRFTYKEFNERVDLLAKGLLHMGLKKGDHIGIWATNVPDWLTFFFAASKIGGVLVTINTAYKKDELKYVMKQSDMKAIALIEGFRDVNYLKTIYELVPELKKYERGKLKSKNFPKLKHVIYIGAEKHRGMYNTHELMLLGKHVPDEKLEKAKKQVKNDDVVNIQYTSGTTGFPKGVMLTHRNILNNGYYIGERQKFTEKDKLCLPVPMFHCFGIVLGLLAILTHGGTLVMLEYFDPLLVLAAVEKEKCTALYGVPTMFISELSHPMFDMFDLSSLRTGIMAGAPCPKELMKKVIEKMHMKEITIVYGLTEASPGITQTSVDDPIDKRVETVGKPLPEIEVKIVDPKTGKKLGPGEVGEICCRGYNVMKGYYKMPKETKEAIDEDGWLHTGDLAMMDKDGYYRIVGRIKEMIIRGGENIYPREIEEFLHKMPGIKDVQIVGVPDEKYGEEVAAFVIKEDGADIREEDVIDYAKENIARYKAPKYVFFVDKFPLTASGKVQKFKLRKIATEMLEKRKNNDNIK